jgi:hypothetical protein
MNVGKLTIRNNEIRNNAPVPNLLIYDLNVEKTVSILIVVEKLRLVPVVDISTGGDEMTARQRLVKRWIISPICKYFIGHW